MVLVNGERNEAGENFLDFAQSYDITIINTYFRKREEHCISYKRGRNRLQIDHFMWKRVKDSKGIPGESVIN